MEGSSPARRPKSLVKSLVLIPSVPLEDVRTLIFRVGTRVGRLSVFSVRFFGWGVLHPFGFVTQFVGCLEEFARVHLQGGALFEEGCDLAQKVFDRSCHTAISGCRRLATLRRDRSLGIICRH
jgi:hypothetical protein